MALESLLVFFILRNGIHKRFPIFFAYVIFNILRAIIPPVFLYADPHSDGAYFYAYWLAIPVEYILTFLIILEVFAYIFRAHIRHSQGVIRAFVIFGGALLVLSVALILWPGVSFDHLTRLILTVNRSISLLMSGLLFFMWNVFIANRVYDAGACLWHRVRPRAVPKHEPHSRRDPHNS